MQVKVEGSDDSSEDDSSLELLSDTLVDRYTLEFGLLIAGVIYFFFLFFFLFL